MGGGAVWVSQAPTAQAQIAAPAVALRDYGQAVRDMKEHGGEFHRSEWSGHGHYLSYRDGTVFLRVGGDTQPRPFVPTENDLGAVWIGGRG